MPTIESTIHIDAPKQKVWDILADFGNIQNFHPGLKSSHSTSSQEGLGATRQCDLKPMGVIQERIVEWNEGESMLVHIYEGRNMPPLDFDTTKARFTLRQEGVKTIATMTMNYGLKGLGGKMMGPMLKPQYQKIVPQILQGLKFYVEKGETPTSQDIKQLAAVAS